MTIKRYDIPPLKLGEWANIIVDTDAGMLAIVSDRGNYAYRWTDPGCEFRQFLIGLEPDYLQKKLMIDHKSQVYDDEETRKAVMEVIEEAEKEGGTSFRPAHERAIIEDDFDYLNEYENFVAWCNETEIPDCFQLQRSKPEPQSWAFCTIIWPRFVEELKKELAAEG